MQTLDRTSPPPFLQSLEFKLPVAEKITPHIWLVPAPDQDVVQVDIVFETGKVDEAIPGLAQFAVQLLNKGVKGKPSEEIANELDYYGAHLEATAGFDFSSLTLSMLSKNLKRLLPLLKLLLESPSYPESEISLYRNNYSENLKLNLQKNDYLASNFIRKNLYGNHAYGKAIQAGDLQNINQENIFSFYSAHLMPSKIFIVGNIEPDDLKFISKELNASSSKANKYPSIESTEASKEIFDGPNKSQASIKLGQITIQRSHKDYPQLQMLNHLLGGFFGSRLMKNIREEKGLTYGIYSSLRNYLQSTNLIISAEVNADKHEQALMEILKEVEQLNNISEAELSITRNHLIGSLQNDISTVFAASERIKNIEMYGLPVNYYQNLIDVVSKANQEILSGIVTKYFNPEKLSTVVVR